MWGAIGGVIFCNLTLLTGYAAIAYAFDVPAYKQATTQVTMLSWILGAYTVFDVVRHDANILDPGNLTYKIPVASVRCCTPVLFVHVVHLVVRVGLDKWSNIL